jgi:Tfp pilus assembly protein PilX
MYLKNRKFDRQQGFVLVLSLVMLAVLTLIGVSSMNSSNMELKATANARQHQVAFNAVQSVLEYAISDTGASLIDYQTSNAAPQVIDYSVAGADLLSATAVYAGCTVGVGSSLEESKGFSYNFFNITGKGSNATKTATSTQNQGVRFPAAACN